MMFDESLEELQQWQLEVGLADLINELHSARQDAETAELRAEAWRQRETELLVKIRDYRKQLSLPDTEIRSPNDPRYVAGER